MKLFVYGSLKKGYYNHRLLKDSQFIRKYSIPGFTLYSAGSYPVAIQSKKGKDYITGEVYEVNSQIWNIINNMERYAGYISTEYDGLIFFVYKDWLKAATKFKHVGHTWK